MNICYGFSGLKGFGGRGSLLLFSFDLCFLVAAPIALVQPPIEVKNQLMISLPVDDIVNAADGRPVGSRRRHAKLFHRRP